MGETIDFELLRNSCTLKVFVSATNVRTGKIGVFNNDELSVDAVLAAACVPYLFQAVEIDGDLFWDGGYMGNPAIFPIIYECDSRDVVVVHVNPMYRAQEPRTAREVLDRINEISVSSSLMREMRVIAFVTKLIDEGHVNAGALKRMPIHAIEVDGSLCDLSGLSKLNADWKFLTGLRDAGRERADRWLVESFDSLNVESTVDIADKYL